MFRASSSRCVQQKDCEFVSRVHWRMLQERTRSCAALAVAELGAVLGDDNVHRACARQAEVPSICRMVRP